jgi:hypothetical protein
MIEVDVYRERDNLVLDSVKVWGISLVVESFLPSEYGLRCMMLKATAGKTTWKRGAHTYTA